MADVFPDPLPTPPAATPLDEARLRQALDALAAADADVARALARVGHPAPRFREPGFATMLRVIAAQQISTKAAAAIWARLEVALGGSVTPEGCLGLPDGAWRAAGFSGRKAEYARGLALAIAEGRLDVDALALAEDAAAIESIASLRGFGRWSAECYLLFALGRVDAFPADDLGLQLGFQRLKGLEARPTAKALRALVEPWAPWRGAGAILLWHYYGSATLDERR